MYIDIRNMSFLCNSCRLSWLLIINILVSNPCNGLDDNCPTPCSCKWKSGKQTVECMKRGLVTIPESIDHETQVFDLSSNNLQILPKGIFIRAGLLNLQRVFLRNSRIRHIDDLAFKGLTNLVELDLSHNILTSVPSRTFQEIKFLRDLILSGNPIQKIDSHAFKTIPMLVKLDLSKCEIQMIAPRAFEGVDNLESLKLNGNQLSELRYRTVETLSRLHGVELHDNPWQCDCRLRVVKEWLVYNNIPHSVDPVCSAGPARVMRKTFSELQIDDYACKPDILPVVRYVEVAAHENATIICRINATPPAHINWYWNGRLLNNNSAFSSHQQIHIYEEGKQEKISSLVLTNVEVIDSTEFYCVAENRAGNAEVNFTLHVVVETMGIVTFGDNQIAGLGAALVIFILFILLVIFTLLVRLKGFRFAERKTSGQIEVVTGGNGTCIANGKSSMSLPNSFNEGPSISDGKHPTQANFCNPVQKPPRINEIKLHSGSSNTVSNFCFVSPASTSGNNPDLINDARELEIEQFEPISSPDYSYINKRLDRRNSGEYSRNLDSLYPSALWENAESESNIRHISSSNPAFHYDDTTPIIRKNSSGELSPESSQLHRCYNVYPPDYGLPIVEPKEESILSIPATQVSLPTSAKILRVWQKGAVPVLPAASALKRVSIHSRNSPDEGYQEGCGTDV